MSKSLLRPDQIRALKEVFDAVDNNNSGDISASELAAVYRAFDCAKSDWEVSDLIAEIDVGEADGVLDFEEFIELMTRALPDEKPAGEVAHVVSGREVRDAFAFLDVNRDGRVTESDLKKAFSALGDEYTDEMISDMLKELQSDPDKGDGFGLTDLASILR